MPNDYYLLAQCIALRAKVQCGLNFEAKLTCASVLCKILVAYQLVALSGACSVNRLWSKTECCC